MKNLLWIFVACSLSLPGADSRPNLSGQWRLDPAKCEGNHPQNMTVAIQQDDNSISVSAQE